MVNFDNPKQKSDMIIVGQLRSNNMGSPHFPWGKYRNTQNNKEISARVFTLPWSIRQAVKVPLIMAHKSTVAFKHVRMYF